MKLWYYLIFLIFFATTNHVFAQDITGFVNDNANILGNEKQQIEQVSQQLYNADLAQIAIVTINSLEGQAIEDAALKLAEGKLGTKDKDNGLLLLISVEDREYRFEVGRGLEPIFNDAKIGRYGRDYLVPAFQKGEYGTGVLLVMNEINNELTGKEAENWSNMKLQSLSGVTKRIQIGMIIVFFIFLIAFIVLIRRSKRLYKNSGLRKRRRSDDRYFWAALIASRMIRGGGGLSGGSGCFGGFGGGSFGGVGASGRF